MFGLTCLLFSSAHSKGRPEWIPLALAVIPSGARHRVAPVARRPRLAELALRAIVGEGAAPASPALRKPLRLIGAAAFVLSFALIIVPTFELAGLGHAQESASARCQRGAFSSAPRAAERGPCLSVASAPAGC